MLDTLAQLVFLLIGARDTRLRDKKKNPCPPGSCTPVMGYTG